MSCLTVLAVTLLFNTILVSGVPQNVNSRVFQRSNNKLSLSIDDWWENAAIYQIYPRSFKDSNNDGIGDLQGIIQKLDYLKDLKVDAIWMSPIFKSPQVDTGYDVADYRDIDPMYGTLDDLRQLVDKAHELNIKVLLDYVPNHTSDQHEWFQASLKKDPTYDEYYIWRNATYVDGERKPPNNWISCFSGSAWEWNEDRQQYYFHQFATAQPDLNYRNPIVVEEMKNVLRYWLNFGVDGFRMDAVATLFEDVLLRDEPESGNPGLGPNDHDFLNHIYTIEQPEAFDMIYQWRDVLEEFNNQTNTSTRIMITEGGANPETLALYFRSQDETRQGAHFTFNFMTFNQLSHEFTALDIYNRIKAWFDVKPYLYANNWLLGNHDMTRVATRLGVENIDAFNILLSMLPGAQMIYQGEEIGQENGEVTCDEGTDPQAIKNCSTFDRTSRDFERTPFQWDNSTNAGFNDGAKTWLPVSEKYVDTNLAKQNVSGINSHYNIYKQVLTIRPEYKKGDFDMFAYGYNYQNIFYAERVTDDVDYAFYFNTNDSEVVEESYYCDNCTIAARSINSDYELGDQFNASQPLKPREAILIKTFSH